ncbi:MAG: DUF819 family protein [Endomicrobia bacterium]|nr:DUF819 family protein [Endomicrobiia bacterium]MCX7716520.1 DUF819 family protein [Endomicrobiia bacterium]
MFSSPQWIITVLICIEAGIFFLAENKYTKKFFNILPPMFWIYFLPMLCSTLGILPQNTNVYKIISDNILPICLVILLLSVDIPAILKLGKVALIMFFAGSIGIIIGGPVSLALFKKWLPQDAWMGLGALSGSWIGGSANMVAVKESIGTPETIFLSVVIVDTIIAYSWMGFLIFLAGYQKIFDTWNKSNSKVIEELNSRLTKEYETKRKFLTLKHTSIIFATGIFTGMVAVETGKFLPVIKNVISPYTWSIILATTFGIILSFTKCKTLEDYGASKIGYWLLYFVLASIGARASLKDITTAPVFLLTGFVWILIHACILFIFARITKSPLFLVATASQANIGGPASAPVVAAVYQPALAPVGLLMAILGNIIGTYAGIICSQLCRIVSYIF